MQCHFCGKKKATVHLTEIVDDQISEMHLCEECAREKSVQMEQQFGLADLLAGLSDFGKQVKDYEKVKLSCSSCKMSYDDFKKFGRLGCSECYTEFESHLASLLKRIHGSTRHLGKSPERVPAVQKKQIDMLADLRNQLQRAVQREDFEDAARLRDEIRGLEKQR